VERGVGSTCLDRAIACPVVVQSCDRRPWMRGTNKKQKCPAMEHSNSIQIRESRRLTQAGAYLSSAGVRLLIRRGRPAGPSSRQSVRRCEERATPVHQPERASEQPEEKLRQVQRKRPAGPHYTRMSHAPLRTEASNDSSFA
jgi:hypothetical protein